MLLECCFISNEEKKPVQNHQLGVDVYVCFVFCPSVVCHVGQASKFNTSTVTERSHGQGQSPEVGHQVGNSGGSHEGSSGGHHRRRRTDSGRSGEEAEDLTLYGLFQLCDLVCNEGTADSTNLCNIKCSSKLFKA